MYGTYLHVPFRVQTVKAVAVQVITNLPVDAIPMAITVVELSCGGERGWKGRGEGWKG